MMSEIPCTPWRSTSSAMRKDSKKPASLATFSSRSLGITIMVSTLSSSSSTPWFGLQQAPLAFKREWPCDHGDCQRAHFAGERRDDRRSAGAGPSAEASCHKHHVRAFQRFDDFFRILNGCAPTHVRIGSGTQPAGQLHAELQFHRSLRRAQRLRVRVGDNELHSLHVRFNHSIDGIAAAAAHSNHLDLCAARNFVLVLNPQVVFRNQRLYRFAKSVFFHVPIPQIRLFCPVSRRRLTGLSLPHSLLNCFS